MPNKKNGRRAPPGPEKGTSDECFVETVDDMVLLRRKLPSGRVISIDTVDGQMLRGGEGIAHVNMDNSDNNITNLRPVSEREARAMLMEFAA